MQVWRSEGGGRQPSPNAIDDAVGSDLIDYSRLRDETPYLTATVSEVTIYATEKKRRGRRGQRKEA